MVRVKTKETDGYSSLQIGAVNHPKPHKVKLIISRCGFNINSIVHIFIYCTIQ